MPDKNALFEYVLLAMFFSMGIGTAPTVCFSLLLLFVWLMSGIWQRTADWWLSQPWLVPGLLLFLLPTIGLIWTIAPVSQAYQLVQRSHYWLFVAVAACITTIHPKRISLALIAGVQPKVLLLFLTMAGIVPVIGVTDALLWRGYLNFSLLLVISIVLTSFLFRLETDRRLLIALSVLMTVDFVALAMLKGRGGYLAFILLSPVIVLNLVGPRRRLVAVAGVLLMIVGLGFSPIVRERLQLVVSEMTQFKQGNIEGAVNTSIGQRMIYWQGALKIIHEHPFVGIGTEAYPLIMKKWYPELKNNFPHPHNQYLHIAVQYGLLGLAIFCWLYWVTLRRAWPYREQWSGFAVLVVLAVLGIGSLTDATLQAPQTGILFALMVGLPISDT